MTTTQNTKTAREELAAAQAQSIAANAEVFRLEAEIKEARRQMAAAHRITDYWAAKVRRGE